MVGRLEFPGIDLSQAALSKRQQVDELHHLNHRVRTILATEPITLSQRLKLCADVKNAERVIDELERAITTEGKNEKKIKPCTKHRPSRPRIVYQSPTSPRPKDPT